MTRIVSMSRVVSSTQLFALLLITARDYIQGGCVCVNDDTECEHVLCVWCNDIGRMVDCYARRQGRHRYFSLIKILLPYLAYTL
jgi:hypothetical protein